MKEALVCLPTLAKKLSISKAPCRELCNFLIYRNNPQILNERARRQPLIFLPELPTTVREVGIILGAEKCEKARKLYFDCTDFENQRAILIHNFNTQFWVHYFRSGIGLVSISCFSQLALAQGSIMPSKSRTIDDSFEYQWFTHDLDGKYFQPKKPEIYLNKLSKYFVDRVNPNLISPYSIFSEDKMIKEPYKFVQGSLERLKEILKLAFFVFEGIRQAKVADESFRFSASMTVTCGNLRENPSIEHPSEWFLNEIGKLAIKENSPYTVLDEGYYRRTESIFFDWIRRNKYYLYLDFRDDLQNATPREKIAARFWLVNWLTNQGNTGKWIIKNWKLSNTLS